MINTSLKPDEVLEELRRLRLSDPSYLDGEVLGSMSTEAPQYLVKAYELFINTNLNDPKLFKNTYMLERECISWLSNLFHGSGYGFLTYGGSESNITALYILREYTGGEVVVAPASAHVSIRKACKLLKLRLVESPLNDRFTPDINALCDLIAKHEAKLACVVMTAGTTDLGIVEPVDRLISSCCDFRYLVHVDAAYGGLIAPFINDLSPNMPVFDFRLSNVCSITVDLHKVVAPIPCSALLLRSKDLEELAYFNAPYMPLGFQRTLLGTRCGGIAAAAWAAIKVLGINGFKELAMDLVRRARYLSSKLRALGVEVIKDPELPIVTFKVPNRELVLNRLWDLRKYVYPTSIPSTIRVVVGPHVTYRVIDDFIEVLANVLRELGV